MSQKPKQKCAKRHKKEKNHTVRYEVWGASQIKIGYGDPRRNHRWWGQSIPKVPWETFENSEKWKWQGVQEGEQRKPEDVCNWRIIRYKRWEQQNEQNLPGGNSRCRQWWKRINEHCRLHKGKEKGKKKKREKNKAESPIFKKSQNARNRAKRMRSSDANTKYNFAYMIAKVAYWMRFSQLSEIVKKSLHRQYPRMSKNPILRMQNLGVQI